MALAHELLKELKQEAAVTRKFLERVPFDKSDYKPTEKSEALGRLAIHVAELMAWWKEVLTHDVLDFIDFEPKEITSTERLLAYFDDLTIQAMQVLSEAKDEDFEKEWSMKNGEITYFTLPKKQVIRTFCMNHLIHHRAQLGGYLRLLDIPVPASYGPSADDFDVIFINNWN